MAVLLCAACSSSDPAAAPSPSVSSIAMPVAYVRAIDPVRLMAVVDDAELVTDDSPAGYHVRNDDETQRTLALAPDVTVTLTTLRDSAEEVDVPLAELRAALDDGRAADSLFRLTIAGGVITEIREQYLP